jgi:WD40 repeat protein
MKTVEVRGARTGIAFSPSGDTIASAGADGTIRLLDASNLKQQGGSLSGHLGQVQAVAFSADGRTLASVGSDGSLRLWDPMSHADLGDPLTGHDGRINAVAFNPDGTTLATSGADGTVRTWTGMLWRSGADLEGRVCRRVSRDLTRGEWESLVPDAPYSRPCPSR